MKPPFILPLAIACAIAALISSAPAEDEMAALKAAAEKGSMEAQGKLGHAYADGIGVAQDDTRAYQWLILASTAGEAKATGLLGRLAPRMTAAQIREAWRQAKEWKPVPPSKSHERPGR